MRTKGSRARWAGDALALACLACLGGTRTLASAPIADGPLARIASLHNRVETRDASAEPWETATLEEPLEAGHRVRTGPVSRAGILYADQTLQRLNENSELELVPATPEKPGFLRLLLGTHYFSSRRPRDLNRIETPTVVASIRGTAFVVEVAADTTTTITLLEGVVEASNAHGSVTVGTGEQAYVEPGRAPVKRIVVRPREAVVWALYYPPILGGNDARRLDGLGDDGRELARAAALLAAGQVGQATPLIDGVLERRPLEAIGLALSAVTLVAGNDREAALRRAEAAVAADPLSPAAALARSFAAQAVFDIPRARAAAERAAELDPDGSLSWARTAELRMAEGDLGGAEIAARLAVRNDPGEARALSVLGFVLLAQYRTADAEDLFARSVAADSESSDARLGQGLALIRRGRLDEGTAAIQIASALDPDDSLLHSYLGKLYHELKRGEDAGKEFAVARELDPSDPTPYLYDAIRKQNENRPAEALADLLLSIERNDNRAVYRSRQLLDEDRAVRGADLARIYNDLGFDQLGVAAARGSADADQSNYSSHHLLAGTYRNLPGFSSAFLSEVLQARIYQPVGVNASRPDAVNETVSFNEYTALFDRPRLRLFATAAYGETDTALGDAFRQDIVLDDSRLWAGDVVGTLNTDRTALAVGYRRSDTDGFRVNNDASVTTYHGFLQVAPTFRDSLQLSVRYGRQETGDLPLRLFTAGSDTNRSERIDTDLFNIGVGYHRVMSPAADLAVSVVHNRTEQGDTVLEGPQVEFQQVLRRSKMSWVLGAGHFAGQVSTPRDPRSSDPRPGDLQADDEFTNLYGYVNLRQAPHFEVTLGGALERAVSPAGLLVPRDSNYIPSELQYSSTRFSPKFGVSLHPRPGTTIRAAFYKRLSPEIGRVQTLEPTQVAGFNQIFFDSGGTRSRTYGAGLDQRVTRRVFAGITLQRRELDIPEGYCALPDSYHPCIGQAITRLAGRASRDYEGQAYFDAVLNRRLALALDYALQDREFDLFHRNNDPQERYYEDGLRTHRVRTQLRFFMPGGLFVHAAGTYYDQHIEEFEHYNVDSLRRTLRTDFWLLDLDVGYRLPRRLGSILLQGRNLGDEEFEFFERAVGEDILPARAVTLSLRLTL